MSLDNQNNEFDKQISKELIEETQSYLLEKLQAVGSFKINQTTLEDALSYIQKYRGAVNVTLNTYDSIRKITISSHTSMFIDIEEDKYDERWYIIENSGKVQTRLSQKALQYYVLDGMDEKGEGTHLIFTYTI